MASAESIDPVVAENPSEHREHLQEDSVHQEQNDDDIRKMDLAARKLKEDQLSESEKECLKEQAQTLKNQGNARFKELCYSDAVSDYTRALDLCPLCYGKERAVMFSNRSACYLHLEQHEDVISDCTEALSLDPSYVKALKRRAEVYEKTEKLDEALADYKRLLEIEPHCQEAAYACHKLPQLINERNEKLKNEMIDKLKDLGNLVLKPFGLSTNNFKLVQNESGGYSVNFQR